MLLLSVTKKHCWIQTKCELCFNTFKHQWELVGPHDLSCDQYAFLFLSSALFQKSRLLGWICLKHVMGCFSLNLIQFWSSLSDLSFMLCLGHYLDFYTHRNKKLNSESGVLLQNIYYKGFVRKCVLSTPVSWLVLYAFWFFLFWYQSSLRNVFTDKSFLPKMAFVWGPVRILAPLPQRSPVESRNTWPGANSGRHRNQKSDLGDFMSAFIPLLLLF